MKIVTSEQMREIEDRAEAAGVSKDALMENAGFAVAERLRAWERNLVGMRVVVLVGPGNNGGDGLVAARHLDAWGARVTLCLCSDNPSHRRAAASLRDRGVTVIRLADADGLGRLRESLHIAQIALDAMLGTGRSRPITGPMGDALDLLAHAREEQGSLRLAAIDLPTGLDANTGSVDPKTVHSDATLALGHPKVGLFRFPGAEYVGRVEVLDIGVPPGLDGGAALELMTEDWGRAALPLRAMDAHKGVFGKALIVGGSRNYVGAPYLAATAAGRVGTGLVTLAIPQSCQMSIAARAMEATYLPMPETDDGAPRADAAAGIVEEALAYQALLIGPGMGQADSTRELVARLLSESSRLPHLVIDADGLNILASSTGSWQDELPSTSILTPHPGEMARLTGVSPADIREHRVELAVEWAVEWRKIVVLKGAFTVVAYPDGRSMLSPFAESAMATAGTGDVLAGAITGLLAQGTAPEVAAALGVYLHGMAGRQAASTYGDAGMLAGDLLLELPGAIRALKRSNAPEDSPSWRKQSWRD